ncbi:hypothetical protein AGMMS50256_26950 [Betaproteobacteria bacterium]|nr:hypothetical protein AGMMS50256_26950 [Betaproteobacteria bacterium]
MEISQFVFKHAIELHLLVVLLSVAGCVALVKLYNGLVAFGSVVLEKYHAAKANAEHGDATLALENR